MNSKLISIFFCIVMILSIWANFEVVSSEPDEEEPILWYGWQSRLVCIKVNPNGLTADFIESPVLQDTGDPMPYTAFLSLTMLEEGSLLWATEESNPYPFISKLFLIEDPKCDGSTTYAKYLGTMPDGIGIEGLYTDSLNRVYIMDTGVQHSSSSGNRLLRFTGDFTDGDFSYEVVGSTSSVPDIDGMGPGIDETTGWVVDSPGFAIDSYNLYNVDYETGIFSFIGPNVGEYSTHAINGSFFSDGRSRLFAITGIPQAGGTISTLYEIDPKTGATIQNLGSGPAGIGLTGSLAAGLPDEPDEPDENEPPVADAGGDQVVNEGDLVYFNGLGSSDSDGNIEYYKWDFDLDDGLWWETGGYSEAIGSSPWHIYGDNGIFVVTLRVMDNENASTTSTCNITVLNVDPIISLGSAIMDVEIGLRVAGRKFNDVGMTLSENEKIAGYISIERMPGSPDDQMAWIPMTLNLSRTYSAVVTYTPEDPPNLGGNPTWVYIKFPNGSIQKIHHTFNVQQSKNRDSDHWNHIEPWEVDISAHLIGWEFEVDYHVSDPGSDDEFLTFTYGSQNKILEYYNDPPNPDPYPSPEVNPRDIYGTEKMTYEGSGILVLQVEDDDGGELEVYMELV